MLRLRVCGCFAAGVPSDLHVIIHNRQPDHDCIALGAIIKICNTRAAKSTLIS